MIFQLSAAFIVGTKDNLLSDLVAEIVCHDHFLVFPPESSDVFYDALEKNSSTSQWELLSVYQGFSPSVEIQTFLSTVSDSVYSYNELLCLASKPALVVLENTREWEVYLSMMRAYKTDATYGNLFKLLENAASDIHSSRLIPRQAGGFSEVPNCLNCISSVEGYGRLIKKKVYVVVDRDTNSYVYPLPMDKKPLLLCLCGKDHLTVQESDIYSLTQSSFIWHMWYRRSIENYFPDSVFSHIGRLLNPSMPPFENNYYAKVEDYYADGIRVKKKDLKNDLGALASHMTKDLYNVNLVSFSVMGRSLNEIQLFLLKMVRII